jgi:hypothetical protein
MRISEGGVAIGVLSLAPCWIKSDTAHPMAYQQSSVVQKVTPPTRPLLPGWSEYVGRVGLWTKALNL